MPADAIARVEQMAESNALNKLKFGDRQNQPEADKDSKEVYSSSSDGSDGSNDGHSSGDSSDDSDNDGNDDPDGTPHHTADEQDILNDTRPADDSGTEHDPGEHRREDNPHLPAPPPPVRLMPHCVTFKAAPAKMAPANTVSEPEWEDAIGGSDNEDATPRSDSYGQEAEPHWHEDGIPRPGVDRDESAKSVSRAGVSQQDAEDAERQEEARTP